MIEATIIPSGQGPSNDKSVMLTMQVDVVDAGTGPSNNVLDVLI